MKNGEERVGKDSKIVVSRWSLVFSKKIQRINIKDAKLISRSPLVGQAFPVFTRTGPPVYFRLQDANFKINS